MAVCGKLGPNGLRCSHGANHGFLPHYFILPPLEPEPEPPAKLTKKERIAALEREARKGREREERLERQITESHAALRRRAETINEFRQQVEKLSSEVPAARRDLDLALAQRQEALDELVVERSRHDDLKTDSASVIAALRTSVERLRQERAQVPPVLADLQSDVRYWRERAQRPVTELTNKQLAEELRRRLDAG